MSEKGRGRGLRKRKRNGEAGSGKREGEGEREEKEERRSKKEAQRHFPNKARNTKYLSAFFSEGRRFFARFEIKNLELLALKIKFIKIYFFGFAGIYENYFIII